MNSAMSAVVRIFRSVVDLTKDVIAIAFPDRIARAEKRWREGPRWSA
jgi:hypothetical protein